MDENGTPWSLSVAGFTEKQPAQAEHETQSAPAAKAEATQEQHKKTPAQVKEQEPDIIQITIRNTQEQQTVAQAPSAQPAPKESTAQKSAPETASAPKAAPSPAQETAALVSDTEASVFFKTGRWQADALSPEERETLARIIAQNPDGPFVISGHTDSVGTEENNHALSVKRAESVQQYLLREFSLAPDKLLVRGYGENSPVADNSTPEGRSLNRRVVVQAMPTIDLAAKTSDKNMAEDIDKAVESLPKPISRDPLDKQFNVVDSLYFPANIITPSQEDQQTISNIADFLQHNPNVKVIVEGHTDNRGSRIQNLNLSLERANFVKNTLATNYSIPDNRLFVRAYGEDAPIADNETTQGRRLNRRVDIRIIAII